MANTYGLNLLSKRPFDPGSAPKNQGQFNSEVLNAAKSTFDPELTTIRQQQQAENATNKDRNLAINNIFRGYANQVANNNTATKNFIGGLQGSETTSGNPSTFDAAIQAAGANPANLTALGLGPSETPQELQNYESTANAAAGVSGNELNNLAANLVASGDQTASNVSGEQALNLIDELNRHEAANQSIDTSRTGVLNSIPGILENERNTLIGQMQSSKNAGIQEAIAEKTYGLNAAKTQGAISLDQARAGEATKQGDAALIRAESTQAGVQKGLDQIALEAQKTNDTRKQAALKFVTSWITPPSQDYVTSIRKTGGGTNPNGTKQPTSETSLKVLSPTYNKNPMGLIQALQTTYGMNRNAALNLVANINVPLEGGQGAQTLGQWATDQLHPLAWAGGTTPSQLTTTPPKRLSAPKTTKKK